MANAENRPFSGTWTYNNKKSRRHVPDCIVTFNGETAMPSCTGCVGQIDLQDLITSVSVTNATDTSPASVSLGMELPSNRRSCFFRDNKFILHPGIEIHVYMRGYFTHTELGSSAETDETYDLSKATMKPYYQVFNGVITDVSHGFSGGFYSVSMSASDFLHFWQYQTINTNPSAKGSKVEGDKTNLNFTGHSYTRKNPFSVVHELFSSGHGNAGGNDWVLSDFANIGIKSDLFQASFWEVTGYYWQQRFQQPMGKLKMYGVDGRLFNSFEQFMLSSDLIGTGEATMKSDKWAALGDKGTDTTRLGTIDNYMDSLLTVLRHSSSKDGEVGKQQYAFPSSSLFYVDNTTWAVDKTASSAGRRGYNVAGVTAFALDISSLGQVNLFESQMQTKMDIASQVSLEIGFEFFIDFNGDYVFKPPFYNLDTSDSRVYVIKDIDLISFNATEKEAECTVMKGTGGYFSNMASLFGKEFENRGLFVDWKGVAKYGWREASFETTFLNDPKSIYYAAMNRLALANKDVQAGDCTIPLRPEMKLGFPVYIEPFDVFYYVTGISHTFGFGSDCTTSLTLTAKRAKFYPPMDKVDRFPKVEHIDFKNIYHPSHALFTKNELGQPKYLGFPCVVMGADLNTINPLWYAYGEVTQFLSNLATNTRGVSIGGNNNEGLLTLIRAMAEVSDSLHYNASGGSFVVSVRDEAGDPLDLTFADIINGASVLKTSIADRIGTKDWTQYEQNEGGFATAEFLAELGTNGKTTKNSEGLAIFFKILDGIRTEQGGFVQKGTNMENYLASLKYMKSNFRPDDQQAGSYRYYSSAFPNDKHNSPSFQGMADRQMTNVVNFAEENPISKTATIQHTVTDPQPRIKVVDQGDGTYQIVNPNAEGFDGDKTPFIAHYGIPIRSFIYTDQKKGHTKNNRTFNVLPTEDIKKLVFSVQFMGRKAPKTFRINASIKFDRSGGTYVKALPDLNKESFDGLVFGDIYDPFIKAHIAAIKTITKDVVPLLEANSQKIRSTAWTEFIDGLEPKYQEFRVGNRTWTRSYARANKKYFTSRNKALRKKMAWDLFTAVRYLNITGTLERKNDLSVFFNSDDNFFEVSSTISKGNTYGSGVGDASEDVLKGDMVVIQEINATVISKIASSTPIHESYEKILLGAWGGHPLFNRTERPRIRSIGRALKGDESFFLGSLAEVPQATEYVFRSSGEEAYYSPVFPVSDEKGFEHFGTYAYARGMTLKTLAEIIDTPPELWGGLSPIDLNRLYGAIGSSGSGKTRKLLTETQAKSGSSLESNYKSFDNNYRSTLNESIANYITTRGVEEVLSTELIAAISDAGVDTTSTDSILSHLQTWTEKPNGRKTEIGEETGIDIASKIFEQAFVGNIITTNQQYGQKIAAGNVPIELARLDQMYAPTSCNGGAANALSTSDAFMVEANQYSFAYNSDTGDFNETAWQQMLAENRVIDWFTHQEALRGEIQEPTITLQDFADSGNAIGDAFSTLSDDIVSVPDVFNQTGTPSRPQESMQSTTLPPPTVNEEDE